METPDAIQHLFSLFTTVGIGIVVLVSLLLSHRYKEPFFVQWTRAYLGVQLSMASDAIAPFLGRPVLLLGSSVTLYIVSIALFVQVGYHLQEQPLPRIYVVWPLLLWSLSISLIAMGYPTAVVATPAVLVFACTFVWLGIILLRRTGQAANPGAQWLAWPVILKGLWIFAYPLMAETPFVWAGYWLDGLLHILVGVGMVIFLLERNASQLQLLIEEIRNHAFFMLSPSGAITSWNSGASRMHGFQSSEILGRSVDSLYSEADRAAARPDKELHEAATSNYVDITGWRLRKDGSRFWAHTVISPIRTPAGALQGFSTLVHDITERKAIEDELKRLAAAVHQAADAIAITDMSFAVLYVNPAFERSSGYTALEAIGQHIFALTGEAGNETLTHQVQASIERDEVFTGRVSSRRKNGEAYTEDIRVSPVRDNDSGLLNYVMVKRDITQEIALEEQLRQAQKMEAFGQLAGGVAHDFGNLLAVIIGFNHLLRTKPPTPEMVARCTAAIGRATDQGAALIRQLMAFSRKDVFNPQVLELNEMVTQVAAMLGRLIGEQVELVLHLASELSAVRADERQLEQVLLNLVVNARDAMPKGGRVVIETSTAEIDESSSAATGIPAGRYVLLSVHDSGMGMDKETLARSFEPFFTTKPSGKGTGLGLSIVSGIIEQSGGIIKVDSVVGQGTSFRIYLPAVAETARTPDASATEETNTRGTETILVVEDEDALRGVVSRIIQDQGYRVLEAGSGEDALNLLKRYGGTVDLLLTDVVMPGMGGRHLAERLHPLCPSMRVLFMSGYPDDAAIRLGASNATTNLIMKPFSPDKLVRKIRDVLDEPSGRQEE